MTAWALVAASARPDWAERIAEVKAGLTRAEEALAAIKRSATPPPECGDAIPVAPARGPMRAFMPREMVLTEAGNWRSRASGWQGRKAAARLDAFDVMERQARNAHARLVKVADAGGRSAPAFVAPFTPGQVQAGRDYAALSERCAAAGLRCASLEGLGGGGSVDDWIERVIADMGRLRAMHHRIGGGLAKEVRRVRPSATGTGRQMVIRTRVLVDMVCIGERTLSGALRAHGWSDSGKNKIALSAALRAALDRMQGYSGAVPQDMG